MAVNPSHSSHKEREIQQDTYGNFIGFLAMSIGMFMAILDIQIVASSLQEIQAGLSASTEEVSLIQTSYLIAEIIMIPLSGWLGRVLSTHIMFMVCTALFTISSVVCAFAWSIESMVIFRVVQGFTGGALIPVVFSTIYKLFSHKYQNLALVIIGLITTLAPTVGPTLGGYLTQNYSWHWLFLINIIPGIVVIIGVASFIRIDRPDFSLLKKIDGWGIFFMAVFLGCLQYVLEKGTEHDWFESSVIIYVSIISLLGGILFFWRELTIKDPVVDLGILKNRSFSAGCLIVFVLGIAIYGTVYLIPVFCGHVLGYNSQDVGFVMSYRGAAMIVTAIALAVVMKKCDPRWLISFGLLCFAFGLWLFSRFSSQVGLEDFILPQIISGVGLLCCILPINGVALGSLAADKLNNASSLFNLMRNLGGAIGLAGLNTMVSRRYDFHYGHLAESVNPGRYWVDNYVEQLNSAFGALINSLADHTQVALTTLYRMAYREAYSMAISDATLLIILSLLFPLALLPFIPAPPKGKTIASH